MTERFANKSKSTLFSSINASVTSLQVVDASSFPTQAQFRLTIDSEIMLVTGVAGATFTVTRGQEGSTAASHAAGATVFHAITAGALDQLRTDAATLDVTATTTSILVTSAMRLIAVGALSAPITVTLPASPSLGEVHYVSDTVGSAGTNNITISGNGNNINASSTFVMNVAYTSITVCWTGSRWNII